MSDRTARDREAWHPAPRSMLTGHRVSTVPGFRPVETRRYPAWWGPFEIVNRLQARLAWHLTPEQRRGLEPEPGARDS